MDSLYELEIAFAQLPDGECPPWLVDRLFRNLLVDMTGNTHRAEFCIDKLYPPEGSGSRLGLLELRAFEMAPHVRMGLVELLLIRALVAAFWKRPYQGAVGPLGNWPARPFSPAALCQQDFQGCSGIPCNDPATPSSGTGSTRIWSFAFRRSVPLPCAGIELELRQALEPWHVLGEEASGSGTVRNVDSSLERLQVKVTG